MSKVALIQLEEAIRIATSFAEFIERSEFVPLAFSIDRRLRRDLAARLEMPPFDQSAMDGYALSGPGRSETYAMRAAGSVRPGQVPGSIAPGQATRISTGVEAEFARLVSNLSEDADFVLVSGGSSIGEGDVTSAGLALAGATVRELNIAMKPGKPAVVGKLGTTSVLALPGNPLAAFVSWFILGRSMMSTMHGSTSAVLEGRNLTAFNGLRRPIGRTEFVPARLVRGEQQELVEFLGGGSGRLLPLSHADGLACIEAVRGSVLVGERVTFLEFEGANDRQPT
ncbi:molybdopterin-binding protein [Bradyrhizobium sp. RT10b]|uniref:molybdopterin-binding protein n=1 Tax=Bradyrhizobium sp. RT10b TaxID=3156331 RepID=UPI0033930E89